MFVRDVLWTKKKKKKKGEKNAKKKRKKKNAKKKRKKNAKKKRKKNAKKKEDISVPQMLHLLTKCWAKIEWQGSRGQDEVCQKENCSCIPVVGFQQRTETKEEISTPLLRNWRGMSHTRSPLARRDRNSRQHSAGRTACVLVLCFPFQLHHVAEQERREEMSDDLLRE